MRHMRALAVSVSVLFHPLFMPLFCVLIAGEMDWAVRSLVHPEQLKLSYLIVALSTIAFPGLNILLLHWYGAVSSIDVVSRKERLLPYLSSLLFFILGYILLRRGALPVSIYSIMLGCISSVSILALVSLKIKASAHAAGIAGCLGVCLALFQLHSWHELALLMVLIASCGLVFSARMVLGVHQPKEVYLGALIGFSTSFAAVSLQWAI